MVRKAYRRGGVALLLALLLAPGRLPAQTAVPSPDGTRPTWIRAEEVPTRAGVLLRRLDDARPDEAIQATVERIERDLARLDPDLDAGIRQASVVAARSAPFVEIEDVRRQLVTDAAPLGPWEATLAAEAKRVWGELDDITHARGLWSATRDRPETVAAGDVVVRRTQTSLDALDAAAVDLQTWRARVLGLDDRLVERRATVDAALEKLQTATTIERASLLVPNRPAFWQGDFATRFRSELPHIPDEIRSYGRGTLAYVERDPRPLVLQVLLVVVLTVLLRRLGPTTVERPISVAVLIALLASPILHPLAPQRFMQLLALVALVPAARVVNHATESSNAPGFAVLGILILADRLSLALAALPASARASALLALGLGMGLTWWVARRAAKTGAPWLRRAAQLAMVCLCLATAAEIGGWANLSTILGRGVLASATMGVYIYAAVIGLEPLVVRALTSPTLRRSHLFDRNTVVLQRRAATTMRWLGGAVWLSFVLRATGLQSIAWDAGRAVLHAGISVGALSLSLGSILAFVLTLLTAMLLARVVNGVLQADVYPRTNLPRGMPYVLSTLVRYACYAFGFLLALAAAGVELGQLSILLGGLGVGVGLGLQDLVKNFAAGLTMLLERRVHVGDSVQVAAHDIAGHVQSIGLRASIIRTRSGSEILVPNGDLVSSAITNWTLSDRLCRFEVPVGVAYGSDPEAVLALLYDAAHSTDGLLTNPAPVAIFKGFGESTLDFVVNGWTDKGYDQVVALTSDLALAVHRVLHAAGIAIPFPQRDLHLASVSPEARSALFLPRKE